MPAGSRASALTVMRDRGERGRVGRLPLLNAPLAGGGRGGGQEKQHAEAAEEDVHGDGAAEH